MPYSKLLSKLIDAKGLTIKEVAERCSQFGQDISASYVSIIKNSNDTKIPSDEVSLALAKACDAEFPECLVIEAYVDKAPNDMRSFLEYIKSMLMSSIIMYFENSLSADDVRTIQSNLNNLFMSELILQFRSLNIPNEFEKSEGAFNTTTRFSEDEINVLLELKQPQGFEVKDNAMYPLIPEGSKVTVENKNIDDYLDGDILVVSDINNKRTIIRKCIFSGSPRSNITLFGLNQEYETRTYNLNEVCILGKAIKLIVDLKRG